MKKQSEDAIYEPGSSSPDNEYVGALILDFLASRNVRSNFLFFKSYQVYDIFCHQSEQTET